MEKAWIGSVLLRRDSRACFGKCRPSCPVLAAPVGLKLGVHVALVDTPLSMAAPPVHSTIATPAVPVCSCALLLAWQWHGQMVGGPGPLCAPS